MRNLFCHCEYIKIETRKRLTQKHFETIIVFKKYKNLWEYSQESISRAVSKNDRKFSSIYIRIEGYEVEEKRIKGKNNK